MDKLHELEKNYKEYISNLAHALPEGIIDVDLELLHKFDLLKYYDLGSYDPGLTRYFHVIETKEKITLVNDLFVVWIVPEKMDNQQVTYTLVALNQPKSLHLEVIFRTTGVYNTSKLVLRVLEKFLFEIQENEEVLSKFEKV